MMKINPILIVVLLAVGNLVSCSTTQNPDAVVLPDKAAPAAEVVPQTIPPNESGSGYVYFDVWQRAGNDRQIMGIYRFNLSTLQAEPVLDGYALQDISVDRRLLLAGDRQNLLLYDLQSGKAALIDTPFYLPDSGHAAQFLSDGGVVWLHRDAQDVQLRFTGDKGSSTLLDGQLVVDELIGVDGAQQIWLRTRACSLGGSCTAQEQIRIVDTAGNHAVFGEAEQLMPAANSAWMAIGTPSIDPDRIVFVTLADGESRELVLKTGDTLDWAWSPDGSRLALLRLIRNATSHEVQGIQPLVIDAKTLAVKEYSPLQGLAGKIAWMSGDSELVILTTLKQADYAMQLSLLGVEDESLQQTNLSAPLHSTQWIYSNTLIAVEK